MDYEEAKKEVEKESKKEDNYMLVSLNYLNLILPYKEGLALMATLKNAEMLLDNYGTPSSIEPIPKDAIRVYVFSKEQYNLVKISALMKMPVKDIEEQLKKK